MDSSLSSTIVELARLLAEREITSRQLVEQALAAIKDPQGEGASTFLLVHEAEALATAELVDKQRRKGTKLPTLAGVLISIKDLFDEVNVVTLGGSKALVGTAPARRDSTVVARLRNAGGVIIGRTNLSEFAYPGLGINPHYGTPKNAGHPKMKLVASRHDATPAQVALAWLFRQPDMAAIPKASRPEHIRENRAALEIKLTEKDIEDLEEAFQAPKRKIPLEMV